MNRQIDRVSTYDLQWKHIAVNELQGQNNSCNLLTSLLSMAQVALVARVKTMQS